jgi:hypothetical protein
MRIHKQWISKLQALNWLDFARMTQGPAPNVVGFRPTSVEYFPTIAFVHAVNIQLFQTVRSEQMIAFTQVARRLPRNIQAQALGTDLFVSFVEQNGLKDALRFSFTSLQIDGRVLRPTQTTGVPTLPFIRRNH